MTVDPLRRLLDRPWRGLTLPPDAVGIPTMLSKTERKLLYSLTRDYASGDAAIVDAGCFLGGSTAALLAGVRDRAEPWSGPPVASYDLFRVEEYTLEKFFADEPGVHVGDSFRPRFDAYLSAFDVPHVVHEGDITELGWDGGPIDVLFLDVLKSWEINDSVLRDFFPSLVPGRSVIVHQDYGWGEQLWIPITVELMRNSLVLVDWMEWGSHVFFLEGELPAELIERGLAGLDLDRRFELMDQAVARGEGWVGGMLEVARTTLTAERDGAEAALVELDAIAARHSQHAHVLAAAADASKRLDPDERRWTDRLAHVRGRVASTIRGGT
jgi:hypothetical protein